MILADISIEGVYRLLIKLVKTTPKDDPEYEHWRRFGERLQQDLNERTNQAARKPGHMDRRYVETEGLRRHGRSDTHRTSRIGDVSPDTRAPTDIA